MTKIEAIIQVSKLESVKSSLHEIGIEGMTVLEARGHGRQKGHTEFYRGHEYTVDLIPKIKIELVIAETMVDKVVHAISEAARTGKIGDGKIFLSHVDEVIRIRNDERGENALGTRERRPEEPSGQSRSSDSVEGRKCVAVLHRAREESPLVIGRRLYVFDASLSPTNYPPRKIHYCHRNS